MRHKYESRRRKRFSNHGAQRMRTKHLLESIMRTNLLVTAIVFAFAVTASDVTVAQSTTQVIEQAVHKGTPASQRLGPHNGTLKVVGEIQTETVVAASGLKVYLYSASGQPVSVESARGVASLAVEGNAKRYRYDLFPAADNSLKIDVDLSKIAGRQISVDYQLVGAATNTITFRDVTVVPADQAQVDAVAIARQKVCPVSGKPLGSMGTPVAVDANGQRVFVCCAGCVDAVKLNPTKYASVRPQVQVVAATAADAALIKKQAKCPVMDESLGSMGQPVKLLIGGKPLFLCCKGCVKKVQAEPEKYLAMVYGNPTTVSKGTEQVRTGVFKVTAADQPFITAQKKCPVMDEPLDAMGGPYKVSADGKAIYICCPGCAKKIAADPQKWLAVLASQGVNAPTLK